MIDSQEFIKYCKTLAADVIVQKYIIESESFFFTKIRSGEEFDFKKDIAKTLDVHIRDIVIVGSGKLGFSLKPESHIYKFKLFDANSSKKSDLDIAVISPHLFDIQMKNLYDFMDFHKKWWHDKEDFVHFALKGRFAIRTLPKPFPLTKEIKQIGAKYKMEYGRTINIEIYKSWYYFETYHKENIKTIQVNLT